MSSPPPPPPDKKRHVGKDYEGHLALSLDTDESNKRRRSFYEEQKEERQRATVKKEEEVEDAPGLGQYQQPGRGIIYKPGVDLVKEDAKTDRYLARKVAELLTQPQGLCDLLFEHDFDGKLEYFRRRSTAERLANPLNMETERFGNHREFAFILSLLPPGPMEAVMRHLFSIARDDANGNPKKWQMVWDHVRFSLSRQPLNETIKRELVREWEEFKRTPTSEYGLLRFMSRHVCFTTYADFRSDKQYVRPSRGRQMEFVLSRMTGDEKRQLRVQIEHIESQPYSERNSYDGLFDIKRTFKTYQQSRSDFLVSNVASSLHFDHNFPADVAASIGPYLAPSLTPQSIRFRPPVPLNKRIALALRTLAIEIEGNENITKAEATAYILAKLV
jgi:hypothetical protein